MVPMGDGAKRPVWEASGRAAGAVAAVAPRDWVGPGGRAVEAIEEVTPAPARRWRLLLRNRTAVVGAVILLSYMVLAIFGVAIAPYPPLEFHYQDTLQAPSATYWLGTDQFGRDIFSRVLAGARTIMLIAFGAMALGVVAGTLVGLTAGYYGGKLDEVIMRVADGIMSFPSLLLALLILTTLGPSLINIIIGVALTFVPRVARIIRSVALDLRTQPFVQAAEARGERAPYIIVREMLPNAIPAIIVESSIRVGYAILIGASLGFLGLGVQPPTPDWGLMIYEGRSMIQASPWIVVGPAIAISTLVIAANLFADGLSRVLDSSERMEDAA
ncbi:MAG: ABC transporter permease [Thermomicrobiales bacterium]